MHWNDSQTLIPPLRLHLQSLSINTHTGPLTGPSCQAAMLLWMGCSFSWNAPDIHIVNSLTSFNSWLKSFLNGVWPDSII